MYSKTKRFIAGAVCPRCGEMDALQCYHLQGKDYRECVACGFKDEMRFPRQQHELDTRVNDPHRAPKGEEEPVQILTLPPQQSK